MGFPGSSAGKESTCNAGDPGLIHELGRSPGEENGYPLQYSSLENSMDYIVHGGHKESDILFTPMLTDYCPLAISSWIVSSVYRSSWHLLLFFQGQSVRLASVPTLMFHFNLITFSYIPRSLGLGLEHINLDIASLLIGLSPFNLALLCTNSNMMTCKMQIW